MSLAIGHERLTSRLAVLIVAGLIMTCGALRSAAQQPIPIPPDFSPGDKLVPGKKRPPITAIVPCGDAGQRCCRAPAHAQNPAFGPLVHCNAGLGCNISTNTCQAPCGGEGQVCCDGPETRALRWTPEGKVFSPTSPFLREMCTIGACDRAKHQCFVCGNADGARCCPPDAAQATARCVGERLSCSFDTAGLFVSGTCHKCGIRGRKPCDDNMCDPGLGLRHGLCDVCSREGQPPCDAGCQPGLASVQGICRACGGLNQTPCPNGCRGNLGVIGNRCTECGQSGQLPCNNGCAPNLRLINGTLCSVCGALNQVPCPDGCNFSLNVANGVCQRCGGLGQMPCDKGCEPGLVLINQVCQRAPSPPDTPSCATVGQACVPPGRPGTQCCTTGQPLVCGFGLCRACVPTGEVCQLGGPQLCCRAGDVCKFDQETGNAVCGIPD